MEPSIPSEAVERKGTVEDVIERLRATGITEGLLYLSGSDASWASVDYWSERGDVESLREIVRRLYAGVFINPVIDNEDGTESRGTITEVGSGDSGTSS